MSLGGEGHCFSSYTHTQQASNELCDASINMNEQSVIPSHLRKTTKKQYEKYLEVKKIDQ